MEGIAASPIVVPLLFLLRCVLPLAVMLLISYLLRKGGWIVGVNHRQNQNDAGGDATPGGSPYA